MPAPRCGKPHPCRLRCGGLPWPRLRRRALFSFIGGYHVGSFSLLFGRFCHLLAWVCPCLLCCTMLFLSRCLSPLPALGFCCWFPCCSRFVVASVAGFLATVPPLVGGVVAQGASGCFRACRPCVGLVSPPPAASRQGFAFQNWRS